MTATFNYTDFKRRWWRRAVYYGVDPATGANEYQVVHIRADLCGPRHLLDRRQITPAWDDTVHGPARIEAFYDGTRYVEADVVEAGSNFNFEHPLDDLDGVPFGVWDVAEIWREVCQELRADVPAQTYERLRPDLYATWRDLHRAACLTL